MKHIIFKNSIFGMNNSQALTKLFEEWAVLYRAQNRSTTSNHTLAKDCKKSRVIRGDIVIDIHWYPIDKETHRDWYDIKISSVNNEAKFIGSTEELNEYKELFLEILVLADITTKSKAVKM